MEKKLIIFTDIGGTIIDESTEVRKVQYGVVYSAECIPGAKETLLELYNRGHIIAMVADGLEESFHNTMEENGLDHVFKAWVISEKLKVEKPNSIMFQTAMDRLGLTDADKGRIIMLGNNLSRDITGANRFGIRSVHIDWAKNYPKAPSNPDEVPTWVIHEPLELLPLAEQIEKELEGAEAS